MNCERISVIQKKTSYPHSLSVLQALNLVWTEVENEDKLGTDMCVECEHDNNNRSLPVLNPCSDCTHNYQSQFKPKPVVVAPTRLTIEESDFIREYIKHGYSCGNERDQKLKNSILSKLM